MDFSIPAERLGLDVDEFIELVELFLETGADDLSGLESAAADNDIQAVVERSHSIKGASGNLGLNDIFETAKDIEARARSNSLESIDSSISDIKQYLENIKNALNQ